MRKQLLMITLWFVTMLWFVTIFNVVNAQTLTYPPSCTVTMPYSNAYFKAGTDVEIHVYSTDIGKSTNNGTVTKVEFYNGTTLLGTATTHNNYTYKYVWGCVPAGTYTIKAKATNDRGVAFTSTGVIITVGTADVTPRGMSACKGKYLANIISNSPQINYNTYWNGVTAENSCKWGSVEGRQNTFSWGGADVSYNQAKNNNMIFRYHAAVWAAQYPTWLTSLTTAQARAETVEYMRAIAARYPLTDQIDVLNEQLGNHQADNQIFRNLYGGGTNVSPTDFAWQIWLFEQARAIYPNTKLILNDYGLENDQNAIRSQLALIKALRDRGLIDGFGTQAHCFNIDGMSANALKSALDLMATAGVPIYVTELDLNGGQSNDSNGAAQLASYQTHFPVYWDHAAVAGITLWGYVNGATWIGGTGLMTNTGAEKPAMTWLKQYVSGKASVGYPICATGACTSQGTLPVVALTAPTNNTVYTEGDNVTINATATITTGSISKVDFYNGTTLLGTDATSPYTYTWNAPTAGVYTITAKATSALNATTTSTAINIQVAKPIYQTGSAPTVDGTVEGLWNNFTSVPITRLLNGAVSSTADLSGNWKAMWDATNLYVLVQVTDDVKRNDAGTDVYNDDNVEVYVDMGNTKATTYGTNDHQYTFRWNDVTAAYEINGHSVTGITKGITNTATGYIVEVSIPWSTMGGTATLNSLQGFDVMINDDDDGTARDGKLAWSATTDDTWSNPSLMGTVILKGLNCTAPTAAITTTTATTFCAGGNVILNASTGTGNTYVWKNGTTTIAGATGASYTATAAGSYTVVVTNAGGCSATSAATTVVVNALPTITQYAQIGGGAWNQTATATVCAGSTIVLGPQPTVATGWSWTGPNGYSATTREITLAGLTATQGGVYTASYTDGNACKATSTFTLTVNAVPTATITTTTPTSFCTGGSVVLTASAGSSYIWKNGTATITGATTQTYTATTAGSYTVEVTNASNCKATSAATTVTVNALPIATITANGPTNIPQGGSVVLTASSGSSYVWKNGTTQVGTAQSYTATEAGSYTVEVTNAGCSSTSAATIVTIISVNQPSVITITSPAANATVTGAIDIAVNITDADGSIVLVEFLDGDDVIGTSTTAPYVFAWNNPSDGSHTITVRVTDSNGGITTSAPRVITSSTISTGVQSSNTLNASVYPNPSNGDVYIETDVDLSNASFTIIDVLGREVLLTPAMTGTGARIDVSNLNEGAYVFIIRNDNSILRKKITVIK